VATWKRSGQTAAAFAAAHGFSPRSLLWWSSTLRRDVPDAKPVAFAPLVPIPSPPRATACQTVRLLYLTNGPSGLRTPCAHAR
jgi:hypothetical protein